jgi:hypothetical protein
MKQIIYILVLCNFTAWGQSKAHREFFPRMKTLQTFAFEPDRSGFPALGRKIDSTKITIYLSETPFFQNSGTNYYLFTISDTLNNTYVDSFLLSLNNDTLRVSAVKPTRLTESGRAQLTLKNVVTVPIIDLRNYRTVQPINNYSHCYLSFFTEKLNIETNTILTDADETKFVMNINYKAHFGHVFRKIYFSTLYGIYNIEYY